MQPERVALLLAAGFSRRYGSDKRLAGSPPLILRTLATLLPCHDSVLVVLRQRDETLRRLLANSGAELTQVPRDGGLGDSLAHGVRTLLASGRPIHSLLITLADMPHLSPASLRALQAAQTGREIVRPLHQGQPGHPVSFPADLFPELASLEGEQGAQGVLLRHQGRLRTLPLDDPGCVQDIDWPEDPL
ncbi:MULTISPECIES: nucleotidyltransferase family protein [Aeromonas]|uniref:Nucleotidyltransferase family protein n=1 Tax=Aeromonas rivipollensis TaxID=948519 RepID=A0ABX0D2N1_9GAMM|nr:MULTISPECIES: nucleotidyltransferase family protein [Aeromonas]NEX88148.1 nucleotidyltransferase family protein [Aeromonas rivipollensis]NEY05642.1 nucleotidyltransferase family protein [Aeromonas rivipollensis]